MKTNKKNLMLLIVMFFAVFFIFKADVYAKENKETEEFTQSIITELGKYNPEKESIREILNNKDKQDRKSTLKKTLNIAGDDVDDSETDTKNYDITHAFRIHELENFIVTDYKKNGKFENSISEDISWRVPYSTKDDKKGITVIDKTDGKMTWVEDSLGNKLNSVPQDVNIIAQKVLNKVDSNERVSKILYTYSGMYDMTLVYVKTNQDEYLIPYFDASKRTTSEDGKSKIVNGTVYTAHKFISIMNKIYDEEYLWKHPDSDIGAVPMRDSKNNYWAEEIILLFVVASICTVFLAIKNKKKRNAIVENL